MPRQKTLRRSLVAFSLVAASLAVCGSDWKQVSSKDVRLSVPQGWKTVDMTSPAFDRAIENTFKHDPNLSALLPQMRQMRQSGAFRLFVATGYTSKGFAENLNVLREDLPAGATWKDWLQGSRAMMSRMAAPGKPFSGGEVQIGGRKFARFLWSMRAQTPKGPITVALRTYGLMKAGGVYVMTFTTLPERVSAVAATADRVAGSMVVY